MIKIITSGAFAASLEKILPIYKSIFGYDFKLFYGSSFGDALDSIPNRIKNGEFFDFYFLAEDALIKHAKSSIIDISTKKNLVISKIGIAAKKNSVFSEINDEFTFIDTLNKCKSIAYAASASGIYLSSQVFPLISDNILKKSKKILSERVGNVIIRDEAEIGFQQLSELLPIKGLKILGSLPDKYDKSFIFSCGMSINSAFKIEYENLINMIFNDERVHDIIKSSGLNIL